MLLSGGALLGHPPLPLSQNDNGQLGNGFYINTDEPLEAVTTDMGNTHSEQIVAGGDFALTLRFDGCTGQKKSRYLMRKYGGIWMDKCVVLRSVACRLLHPALLLASFPGCLGRTGTSGTGWRTSSPGTLEGRWQLL